jgi:DNA-binding NarL/FixJ family response regulator
MLKNGGVVGPDGGQFPLMTRDPAFSASRPASRPITVALVDDYDVVLAGVARILAPYEDRVRVVEIDTKEPVTENVDIVLYDSFAQPEAGGEALADVVANRHTGRVVIYTWNFSQDLIDDARARGAAGYLSKTLTGRELAGALEAVHAGEIVVSPPPRARATTGQDWPGRNEGLTEREAEILALITQGRSNAEIAEITRLSPNTVKSYIRSLYRRINVGSRSQAVLWGVQHGFAPDHDHLIQSWRADPSVSRG